MRINNKECRIPTTCPLCGKEHIIFVNLGDYLDWINGDALTQDAFPYLSADEREMLISGICPRCWAASFSDGE
jgi:hypothetical protein